MSTDPHRFRNQISALQSDVQALRESVDAIEVLLRMMLAEQHGWDASDMLAAHARQRERQRQLEAILQANLDAYLRQRADES